MWGSYPHIPFILEFNSVRESTPVKQQALKFPAAAVKESYVSADRNLIAL